MPDVWREAQDLHGAFRLRRPVSPCLPYGILQADAEHLAGKLHCDTGTLTSAVPVSVPVSVPAHALTRPRAILAVYLQAVLSEPTAAGGPQAVPERAAQQVKRPLSDETARETGTAPPSL